MDKIEQLKHFDELTAELRKIIESKGDDYAGDDRLFNFKAVATMTKIKPQTVCLTAIATKVARLSTLYDPLRVQPPRNESVQDSIKDLINYTILLHMVDLDEGQPF